MFGGGFVGGGGGGGVGRAILLLFLNDPPLPKKLFNKLQFQRIFKTCSPVLSDSRSSSSVDSEADR